MHHSDRGGQYLSIRYAKRLADAGIDPSVGSVGDSYGNALAESVIGLFKTEVIRPRRPWRDLEAVEMATLEWVDWFNNQRLQRPDEASLATDYNAHREKQAPASSMTQAPEAAAREDIDAALTRAGWVVQDRKDVNLGAALGVAVREFPMAPGHGFADYLLFVDGSAVGAFEAKAAGHTLSGVEGQVRKYGEGLPSDLDARLRPLPFLYVGTGVETTFTNQLDPEPRSRRVYAPHRPETLAEWLGAERLATLVNDWTPGSPEMVAEPQPLYGAAPSSLRSRLRALPAPRVPGLWPNQEKAIAGLERSLQHDRPRALIQMATGSGKSLMAVAAIYRLIKFGGARRVLFLVDRSNLGAQAEGEFANYRTYDDHRKFTELYNVQRLTTNKIGSSSKVVITTIQRLFSMLKGEPEFDGELEEISGFDTATGSPVLGVEYNATIPPEYFDIIVIDECHRSIYTLWRQVLEYFDAYLIGLTATPAKHTFGFFNQNLVMEYSHDEAVADNVNVDFDIYKIRTKITEVGSKIEAAAATVLPVRERRTRALRWEAPDDDIAYTADQLDRDVVAKDQIRLIVRTFRDRLFTEIFPGRTDVPKTLIFAKDDSHAEDIVQVVREEFGKSNDFCTKITYKSTGKPPQDLIQEFRTGFHPRIAVTVDMIATGTDVRPIEIVMFLRSVKSRVLFEQMKGRGGRVIEFDELRGVTPDATSGKTHFVLVDCVGVSESATADTQPLDRKPTVSFDKLLEHVAFGGTDPDLVSSLASRLSRLDKRLGPPQHERISAASGGVGLGNIAHAIVDALSADAQAARAREKFEIPPAAEPTDEQITAAGEEMIGAAVAILATKPKLRRVIKEIKQHSEQIIDEISQDELLEAGASPEARDRARHTVQSFERYIAENKDEIVALQFFYSQPYDRRLRYDDIKELAAAIAAPPRSWTPERLWQAYEQLDSSRVRGASSQRQLTDIVSLIGRALDPDAELVPYAEQVNEKFDHWVAQQQTAGRDFTDEQTRWLEMIRDHIAQSLEIGTEDFDLTPFVEEGGLGRAEQVFGGGLPAILQELNEALAA